AAQHAADQSAADGAAHRSGDAPADAGRYVAGDTVRNRPGHVPRDTLTGREPRPAVASGSEDGAQYGADAAIGGILRGAGLRQLRPLLQHFEGALPIHRRVVAAGEGTVADDRLTFLGG